MKNIAFLGVSLIALAATSVPLQFVSEGNGVVAPSAGGGGNSMLPVLRGKGRYVLLASSANNLALTARNRPFQKPGITLDVFLRDDLNQLIMKPQKKAFTLIELLVVVTLVAIIAATLLPALASTQSNTQKMTCLNNLKQVGLAYRMWEGSNNGRYPMAVSSASGGVNEFMSHSGASSVPTAPTKVECPGMAFLIMSNLLSSPKVLFCPSDNVHTANSGYATNFSFPDLLAIATPALNTAPAAMVGQGSGFNSKISYFINGDATEANPQDIMTGDDNIGNNGVGTSASSVANFRFGASAGANTCAVAANGTTSIGITATAFGPSGYWAWTANDFHKKSGNLGMADGSCQSVTISGLHYYLNNSTNSASAEAVNFMP